MKKRWIRNLLAAGLCDQMQIRSGKRCNTVQQQYTVNNSQYQPEQCYQDSPEHPSVKQINNQ